MAAKRADVVDLHVRFPKPLHARMKAYVRKNFMKLNELVVQAVRKEVDSET